jgi:dihydroorotase
VLPYDDAPAGLPGVEWMLPLFVDAALCGRVPWDTLVRLCCEGPARVFGIPNKGRIEPGCDADLAIFDPSATRTIDDSGVRSRCGWTPYAGRTLRGALVKTLLRGNERESPGAGVEVRFPRC